MSQSKAVECEIDGRLSSSEDIGKYCVQVISAIRYIPCILWSRNTDCNLVPCNRIRRPMVALYHIPSMFNGILKSSLQVD